MFRDRPRSATSDLLRSKPGAVRHKPLHGISDHRNVTLGKFRHLEIASVAPCFGFVGLARRTTKPSHAGNIIPSTCNFPGGRGGHKPKNVWLRERRLPKPWKEVRGVRSAQQGLQSPLWDLSIAHPGSNYKGGDNHPLYASRGGNESPHPFQRCLQNHSDAPAPSQNRPGRWLLARKAQKG